MLKSAPFYAAVPVRDLQRARRFYEQTLGLGPASHVGPALSFPCGRGTTCLLLESPAAGTGSCAFWQVDDLEAVVAWLRARGVHVDEPPGAMAWFRDSEGNRMAVMRQPGPLAKPRRDTPAVGVRGSAVECAAEEARAAAEMAA